MGGKNSELTKAFDELKMETQELRSTRESRENAVKAAEEQM
jgi:phage regulator Rha-like protein